jgi:hypothetical protein
MLIQMVEANGTHEPTLDSWKSDGAEGGVVITASRWPPGLIFLLIVILFLCLVFSRLLLTASFSTAYFPSASFLAASSLPWPPPSQPLVFPVV